MVGFRVWGSVTSSNGAPAGCGLGGHVRNRADGAVEVYAVGPPDALALLGRQLRAGPPYALVEKVEETEASVRALTAFTIEF